MQNIITDIRKELKNNSDPKNIESSQRFFKEDIKLYGLKGPLIQKISKEYFKTVKQMSKTEIFEMCDAFWKSGYIEESFIACNWSYNIHKKYENTDFKTFENWVSKYVTNWASCDTFCNHTIGKFIEMYPDYISRLKNFAVSDNRWMRRAAAVSLIVPAKKGKFLKDILEIADILLLDQDDMVQKGYGWMLKVSSQAHQQSIFEYVISKKAVMPRTALRYAIEKMPKEMKIEAMRRV